MNRLTTLLTSVLLILTACAEQEVLEPIDGTVPEGVDLSGYWSIRASMADDQRRLREAIRRTDGVRDTAVRSKPPPRGSGRKRDSSGVKGGLVYVFLETGDSLKITQTPHALFVSFDRSVVEEFRFGENRMISVGEVQAQRVTGWQDQSLTVETLDKNGMKLIERYQLADGGKSLERFITFRSKNLETQTILQEFDRSD